MLLAGMPHPRRHGVELDSQFVDRPHVARPLCHLLHQYPDQEFDPIALVEQTARDHPLVPVRGDSVHVAR